MILTATPRMIRSAIICPVTTWHNAHHPEWAIGAIVLDYGRARELGLLDGQAGLYPYRGDVTRPGMSCDGVMAGQVRDQAAGFQEILRKLAMVHEGFVQDKAR